MSRVLQIDLFAEDLAHELFLRPMVERVCAEQRVGCRVRVRSARGGHGRAMAEVQNLQQALAKGVPELATPEILVVAIDANCEQFAKARKKVEAVIRPEMLPLVAIACPDPHIERWYLADPVAVERVVGRRPSTGKKKCAREHYKDILHTTMTKAGVPAPLGGIELAPEIVAQMDLFKAGKSDGSLRHFLGSLRAVLARVIGC